MDAFTAGIALIVTQLCTALVMAGIFYATPSEKCTRYWMLSEIFIAVGVLLVIANAGAPRYAILIIGNNSLIWGAILQWWGLQKFYRTPVNKLGWILGATFFLLFGLLLLMDAKMTSRGILTSATMLVVFMYTAYTLWLRAGPRRRTFGNMLALGALTLLAINNIFRIVALELHASEIHPGTASPIVVAILYLVPLAGSLLYATSLLLLYFERIVGENRHLATHDELTGLLNRRAIVSAGEREVAVALRNRQSLAIAFVDADFFKRINDKLGHNTGDAVLCEIANIIKMTCRDVDLVGRYGGEEFCVVLPGVSAETVALVGERLVRAVRQYHFCIEDAVSVSIGLAVLAPGDDDRSWTNLIKRADDQLYRAKELGRDRFCIAPRDVVQQQTAVVAAAAA